MNFSLSASSQNSICQFIREAGQKAVYLRAQGFQVDEKGFDDFVTNVDRELDRLLSEQFQAWFPEHIVISEESQRSQQLWEQRSPLGKYENPIFWLIDPIDGTDDFIHGREFYSVMVGVLAGSQPVLGWVYAPKSDLQYFGGTAIDGIFTITNGNIPERFHPTKPIAASRDRLIVSKKDDLAYGAAIKTAVPHAEFYSLGSFGLKVMEVLQGRASAYIYLNRRVKIWDTAAPLAIAHSAGLVCCDLEGKLISFDANAINPEDLTHNQIIIVAWQEFIDEYLEAIAKELRVLL
ncbi:inositol monophosphatase family protein [Pseudanabaena sp. FACHB-1277]|uniref:3'(2'),5-bisphosphonucleoside 3'(2')-phosphohydrolase n=1 Tax=Pseudanabaena cinerea FACHB-1277 TaxID=2949581 RepID=A0A926UP13_9CYAN|nr:inositol monophosphatase family protein [Pseudanabaena cinerea]MBD2148659.1 inositol monophosphatase family protein [Pseudanabaena cinerea FACHB-1277]